MRIWYPVTRKEFPNKLMVCVDLLVTTGRVRSATKDSTGRPYLTKLSKLDKKHGCSVNR